MLGTSLDGEESEEETEEYSRPSILSCSVNYLNNQHGTLNYIVYACQIQDIRINTSEV